MANETQVKDHFAHGLVTTYEPDEDPSYYWEVSTCPLCHVSFRFRRLGVMPGGS